MNGHTPPQLPDLDDLTITRHEDPIAAPSSRNAKRFGLLSSSAVILVGIAVYWFLQTSPGAVQVRLGTVETIQNNSSQSVLTASGYVMAQRQASVASKGTGRLKSLQVQVGDQVTKGQIIAQLEQADVQARLRQVQARLEVAQATLANANPELSEATLRYQRVKALWDKAFVTREEFEATEARLRRAKASVRSSRSAIKLAHAEIQASQVDIENTIIRSPFDGIVIKKFAEVGEIVAPMAGASNSRGSVLAIADFQTLQVETEVSESLLNRVQINQPVKIVLDAVPGHAYEGTVVQIVPTADRTKAVIPVKIAFQETDERILPEMSATVTFFPHTPHVEPATLPQKAPFPYTVPLQSIVHRKTGPAILAVYDEMISEIPVELGESLDDRIQIRGNVTRGDSVVMNPVDQLRTGTRIGLVED